MDIRWTWLLCAMALAVPSWGQEEPKPWKLSGFGTLGLAWNNNDTAGFRRDLSQPEGTTRKVDGRLDSRLGLQFNAHFNDSLQFNAQVVSKYQYDHTFKPEVTWLFLGWNPNPDLLVRVGRVGFDLFMDSDSRNIGYSYLWARPPVEYFGGITFSHLDGIDIADDISIGDSSTLRLKAFAGFTAERLPFTQNESMNLTGGKLGGLVAELISGSWRGRLGYGVLRTRHDFPAPVTDLQAGFNQFGDMLHDPGLNKTADDMRFSERTLRFSTASLIYEEGALQTQAALGHFDDHLLMAQNSWMGFLSCGYRFGQVVPYAVWSRGVSQQPQPYFGALPYLAQDPNQPPQVSGAAGQLVLGAQRFANSTHLNRYTLTAGTRWDLAPKASLKFQVDRIRSNNSPGLWLLPDPPSPLTKLDTVDGWSTVLSAVLDFVF